MRQMLVAGNWKMNGSRASIGTLMAGIKEGLPQINNAEVLVCPPFVYLDTVRRLIQDTDIMLGAQKVCDEDAGAFTGEVAAPMLQDFECKYAIVGHSERRNIYHESDVLTARKFAAARRNGLTPILCVGESLDEREQGLTETVVERQIEAVIEHEGVLAIGDAVIAYEPIWAIGTGKTATPQEAQDVHAFIRHRVMELEPRIGEELQILYGGSVKGSNAAELFAMPDIDGGLIGGGSLSSDEFLTICKSA